METTILIVYSCVIVLVTGCAMPPPPMPCSETNQCPEGECCVTLNGPRGKRATGLMDGECRPVGQVGSFCYADLSISPPAGMYFACPCDTGLGCQGTGDFENPIGSTGTCEM